MKKLKHKLCKHGVATDVECARCLNENYDALERACSKISGVEAGESFAKHKNLLKKPNDVTQAFMDAFLYGTGAFKISRVDLHEPKNTWQQRYMKLLSKVQEALDVGDFALDEVPPEPASASEEVFISNDLQVCDNEAFAQNHWGEGRYRRFVLADFEKKKS